MRCVMGLGQMWQRLMARAGGEPQDKFIKNDFVYLSTLTFDERLDENAEAALFEALDAAREPPPPPATDPLLDRFDLEWSDEMKKRSPQS
jgi:hypothetical protein